MQAMQAMPLSAERDSTEGDECHSGVGNAALKRGRRRRDAVEGRPALSCDPNTPQCMYILRGTSSRSESAAGQGGRAWPSPSGTELPLPRSIRNGTYS